MSLEKKWILLFGVEGRERVHVHNLPACFDLFHSSLVYTTDSLSRRRWSRSNFLFPFPRLMTFAVKARWLLENRELETGSQKAVSQNNILHLSDESLVKVPKLFVYINNTATHSAFSQRQASDSLSLVSTETKFKSCFESPWGVIYSIYSKVYIAKKRKKSFRIMCFSSLL